MTKQDKNKKTYSSGEKAILEAAEILFAEKGFDAVSMSAIAKMANTSKPNIYHHFKNKNDLYMATMETAVRRSAMLLDTLESSPGSPGQHLSDFAAGQLKNILEHKNSTQLILREALMTSSENARVIAENVVGNVFSRLTAMVEQGQKEGQFRKDIDPTLAAFMMEAANMFFFQARPVMKQIPEANFNDDIAAYSKGVMDIIFNGMLLNEEKKS